MTRLDTLKWQLGGSAAGAMMTRLLLSKKNRTPSAYLFGSSLGALGGTLASRAYPFGMARPVNLDATLPRALSAGTNPIADPLVPRSRRDVWRMALNDPSKADALLASSKAYREQHPDLYKDIYEEADPDKKLSVMPDPDNKGRTIASLEPARVGLTGKGEYGVTQDATIGIRPDWATRKPLTPEILLHEHAHATNPGASETGAVVQNMVAALKSPASKLRFLVEKGKRSWLREKLHNSTPAGWEQLHREVVDPSYFGNSPEHTSAMEIVPVLMALRPHLENLGVDTSDPAQISKALKGGISNTLLLSPKVVAEGGLRRISMTWAGFINAMKKIPADKRDAVIDDLSEKLPGISQRGSVDMSKRASGLAKMARA